MVALYRNHLRMPFNYVTDRSRAEIVLRRLCVGAQIDGIRFGVIPQLLITDQASGKPPINGQVYLNLGSTWCIYPNRPESLPLSEDTLLEHEESEALRQLCEIREAVIVEAELALDAPDLLFGVRVGAIPRVYALLLTTVVLAVTVWQIRVLQRADVVALFPPQEHNRHHPAAP